MSDDYGYFGKGTEGYVHYMQAFNESNKGGGGGSRPPSGGGCLSAIIKLSVAALIIYALISALIK